MPRRSRTVNATGSAKAQKFKRYCRLSPWRQSRQEHARTAEECGRSAAQQRHKSRRRPPIPGESALCRGLRRGPRGPREKSRELPLHRPFFVCQKVDKNTGRRLYTPSWTRRRSVRWRVCEAPHCSHGDRIRPFRHGHVRVAASDVRGLTPPGHGGRSCKVPGCLTSESEERETWTAESLRTASSNGEDLA